MPNTMTLIATITVPTDTSSQINFTSIPQTYTDLFILLSGRDTATGSYGFQQFIRFNSDTATQYSSRRLYGLGNSTGSANQSGADAIMSGTNTSDSATANTFSSTSFYIPNYAGSTYKSVSIDNVSENNATNADQTLIAGLWSKTNAITEVNLLRWSGWKAGSTASLYGILKGSGGATVS